MAIRLNNRGATIYILCMIGMAICFAIAFTFGDFLDSISGAFKDFKCHNEDYGEGDNF